MPQYKRGLVGLILEKKDLVLKVLILEKYLSQRVHNRSPQVKYERKTKIFTAITMVVALDHAARYQKCRVSFLLFLTPSVFFLRLISNKMFDMF